MGHQIKLRLYDSERPFGMKTLKICPTTDQMLRCMYQIKVFLQHVEIHISLQLHDTFKTL